VIPMTENPFNLKKVAIEIAKLSAHEYEPNRWWGNDTDIGNLPKDIERVLRMWIREKLDFWFKYRDSPEKLKNDYPELKDKVTKIINENLEMEEHFGWSHYNDWLLKFAFKGVLEWA